MSDLAAHWRALDAELVARGWPACSPWWHDVITSWVVEPRRQLVLRVGRRGGKSSTLCRLAVLWALAVDHPIPPGDVGVIAFVSTSRDEASQRLRTIRALLDALGVAHRATADTIELADRPIVFRVFACSIAAVSGFTGVLVIADELAKWRDADNGANPATEVLAALRPTLATQPHGRLVLSSSPLSVVDAHAEAFELGDTEFQRVAHAATWVANPTISEAETRRLEPDPKIWAREYAAEPSAASSSVFEAQWIDDAMGPKPDLPRQPRVMILDPSSGRADSWTWLVACWRSEPWDAGIEHDTLGRPIRLRSGAWLARENFQRSRPYLDVVEMGGWDGAFAATRSADDIVGEIARKCHSHGIRRVWSDQHNAYSLEAMFAAHRLGFKALAWTAENKTLAVGRIKHMLQNHELRLPSHPALRRQLLAFSEVFTANGGLTFRVRGQQHDDYAMVLMLLGLVDTLGGIPGVFGAAPKRCDQGHPNCLLGHYSLGI